MNLYLLSQSDACGYDTYDSAVVAAEDTEAAQKITPNGEPFSDYKYRSWASTPDKVSVVFLASGYDGDAGIILASFNAG